MPHDESKIHSVLLTDIHWNTRQRDEESLPDIEGLAVSIELYKQIMPIVITEDHELIDGRRRLEAAKRLGYTTIKAIYRKDIDHLTAKLLEYEANAKRVDLTWQEDIRAKMDLLVLKQEVHGAARVGRPGRRVPEMDGYGLKELASATGVSMATLSRDITLARVVKEHPELAGSKSKASAWRKMRSLEESGE